MCPSPVAVAVLTAAALLATSAAEAEPFRPERDDVVLLRLPPGARASSGPQTPESLVAAAAREMALGRASFDERHFGRAEALLLRALPCVSRTQQQVRIDACKDARDASALLVYADLLQHGHAFENSIRVLDVVLEADPSNQQARLLRASVRLARGEPHEALRDCTRLFGAADSLVASACIAHSISLTGRLNEGVDLLTRALNAGHRNDSRAAWALAILSELLERQGKPDRAIETIERAISADPANGTLRVQAADLLLRHDAPGRAMELIVGLPDSSATVVRRAVASARLGSDSRDLLEQWRKLVTDEARFGRSTHERDRAIAELYVLMRPAEALKFAAANWQKSREIEDARIYIFAAEAAARPQDAEPVRAWMRTLHVEDAILAAADAGRRR